MATSATEPLVQLQSQRHCYAVFEETLGLAQADPHNLDYQERKRLDHLLLSYFQDDASGACFRSMICYGCDDILVSITDFNNFVVLPGSQFAMELIHTSVHTPIHFRRVSTIAKKELHHNTLRRAYASVDFVLQHVTKHYFAGNADIAYHTKVPLKWKNGIIGNVDRAELKILHTPSLEDLHHRIRTSLEFSCVQKKNNPGSFFYSSASALAWKANRPKIDYDILYLQGCSDFPTYLAELIGPDQYLDHLAGVVVNHSYPEVEARFQKMYDQAPARHIDGHDLKLGKDTCEIGGTVVAIHQYVSPSFLAYYTVDHDASCAYMRDERSSRKKNRKIRVASVDHVDTKPIWLQFGETNDVYLYLSQKASAAEEKWLCIVNFVMNLLVDFVNKRIKEKHGQNTHEFELMRKREYGVIVASASNPLEGNFGWHKDGKNGIVAAGDAKYSSFQLMVPTLCLQNYAHPNTTIEWAPVTDPTYIAGSIVQECILVHIQLLAVNEKFIHHVSCRLAIPNLLRSHLCFLSLPNPFISQLDTGFRLIPILVQYPIRSCSISV